MDFLTHTWHWSVAGFLIAVVMLLLNYFGKVFGMSSNLRSLCAITGVGKKVPFFDWDWKSQRWNLVVVVGASTQFRFQKAGSHKHQIRRDNQFNRLGSNQQTTLISPCSNLNNGVFQRSFIQIRSDCWGVTVNATRNQRM